MFLVTSGKRHVRPAIFDLSGGRQLSEAELAKAIAELLRGLCPVWIQLPQVGNQRFRRKPTKKKTWFLLVV